jgi:hypothetical protein
MKPTGRTLAFLVLGSTAPLACVVDRNAGTLTGADPSGAPMATDPTSGGDSGSGDSGESGDRLDLGVGDLPTESCASVMQSSTIEEGPSDILIVVDQAISHDQLQPTFQNFSLLIGDDQVEDARVVMIAGYPSDGGGVCIQEPPLGTGQCPTSDDNPPMYVHIDETIASATLLSQVLDTYDAWAPSMRDDAWKHVWIVSGGDPAMDTDEFLMELRALDPAFERLTVHAMVPDEGETDCASVLPGEMFSGAPQLRDLAIATGGVFESLCDYNVKSLFNEMLDRIKQVALSCTYEIPPPPDGQVFDKGRVNVDYDDGFGLQTIGWVDSVAECPFVSNGWYYDDPGIPTQIEMCPQTCSRFATLEQASIEIRFGCTTIPAA